MKKIFFGTLFSGLMLMSCSTIQNGKQAQQNRAEFLKMKGDWVITNISYDSGFKIKPFNEGVDVDCFKGSQWKLVPNNYSGSYTLTNCKTITQPFKFEVIDANTFQFKKINEGVKAKNSIYGYKLTLINRSENSFSLSQNVPFDGEMVNIVYQFERVNVDSRH